MQRTNKRTDIHRPGAILPRDYTHVLSFSLAASDGGMRVPPVNLDCLDFSASHRGERCCVARLRDLGAKLIGNPGNCTVCGAHYVYGDVFRHVSGEHVFMGHDCADKYQLLADRSEWEMANMRTRRNAAAELNRQVYAEERAEFLSRHPGLAEALECEHRIVRDIADGFITYRSLSEKQIDLVFKLASEAYVPAPAPPPESQHVGTVGERRAFALTINAQIPLESAYGTKYLHIMTDDDGNKFVWFASGSLIANPAWRDFDKRGEDYVQVDQFCRKGDRVVVKATIKSHGERDGVKQTVLTRVK